MQEDNSIYASLSHENKLLLYQSNNGMLLERRGKADNAYGHGRGVYRLNIRERAVLRAWSADLLSKYFNE